MFSNLDTVGFLTRSIQLACRVSEVWLANKVPMDPDARPARLLWPKDLFPIENEVFEEAIETFVSLLEKFMKVKSVQVNLQEM